MNWLRNLFSKAASFLSFVPTWVRHSFSLISYEKLIREGYRVNSAVSACVTTLAFSFPEPPLLAGYDEDGRFVPDYTHPIMKLIKHPNPDMGEAELMQFVITYTPTGGNCYFWKQRSASGKVVALWPFSDRNVMPVPGQDTGQGFVAWYEYDAGDGKKKVLHKEDVIQWKWMIDPLQPWKGIGAIELCAREVDKDSETSSYIFSLLKNNAVPPVVITLEEGDDSSQEEIDALGLKWIQKHSRGQPAFISSGMKVEQMGFDLHKLASDTLGDIPESRIAANFRVPPSVAGLNVGIKRSDYGDTAARRAFTETTLMPLWRSLASELLNGLKDEFPGTPENFVLQFDLRRVGALQEEESKRWDRLTLAFDRSAITRKTMKEMLGLKPEAGDDVYKVSLATEFISAKGDGVVDRSVEEPTTNPNNGKSAFGFEEKKKRDDMRAIGQMLQRVRLQTAGRMEGAVDAYFTQLSERVLDRAKRSVKAALPDVNDLLNDSDKQALGSIVKRFYAEVLQASWQTWNMTMGVELAFDLNDPLVTRILKMAELHVETIQTYTVEELNRTLVYGSENGWGIDQLVRGDPENNIPGLRQIVEETYKNRARVIARTELGEAQNSASAMRYESAGVELVEILDNGLTDDDPECQAANGQVWSLSYFTDHLLEHPNCTRCSVPYFGRQPPDRS